MSSRKDRKMSFQRAAIFYRLNNHFLLLNEADGQPKDLFVPTEVFAKLKNRTIYPGRELNFILKAKILKPSKNIYLIGSDNFVCLYELTFTMWLWLKLNRTRSESHISKIASSAINQFRHLQKEHLLEKFTIKSLDFKSDIDALASYTFCEHYSVWSYHELTNSFVCEVSSFDLENEFLENDDSCGLSNLIIKSASRREFKQLKDSGYIKAEKLKKLEIKSINRILISVINDDSSTKNQFILNLYSAHPNFKIQSYVLDRVESLAKQSYIKHIILKEEERLDKIISCMGPSLSQSLPNYLNNCCRVICEELRFEACSIFLFNEAKNLVLSGTKDFIKNSVEKKIIYPINSLSNTASVARENKTLYSYNLKGEKQNSHIYDEEVEDEHINWLGTPLSVQDEIIGVLRVKNKYSTDDLGSKVIKPFKPIHIYSLFQLRDILATAINIYTQYEKLESQLEENNDFTSVLLHEIRTPISKFTLTPTIIKRRIEVASIEESIKSKILLQLGDIQMMGNRLKHLVDIYNIDEITKGGDMQRLSLLNKVIYPVKNITGEYLEKQHGSYLSVNISSMHNWHVFGDERLYQLTLNALIENAAKYRLENSKTITVDCEYSHGAEFLYIIVSNKGLLIDDDEIDTIFAKRSRGRHAKKALISGTGIGLYLARESMRSMGGDLYLRKQKLPNDITFVMKIPVSNEMVA